MRRSIVHTSNIVPHIFEIVKDICTKKYKTLIHITSLLFLSILHNAISVTEFVIINHSKLINLLYNKIINAIKIIFENYITK